MSRRRRSPSPKGTSSTSFRITGMKDGGHSDDGGRGKRNRNNGGVATATDRKQDILSRLGGPSANTSNTRRSGAIQKKTGRRVGGDRDGDLSMNASNRGSPYSRGNRSSNRVKEDLKDALGGGKSNGPVRIMIRGVQNDNHSSLIDYLSKNAILHYQYQITQPGPGIALIGLSGCRFSGQSLVIEKAHDKNPVEAATAGVDVMDALRAFLRPRYVAATQFLNLESMYQDPHLMAQGIDSIGQAGKDSQIGPVLMKLVKEMFPDVISISLADNRLASCQPISTICHIYQIFKIYHYKNNRLPDYKSIEYLKGYGKLKQLRELVLIGNPVREEAIAHAGNDIVYRSEIARRFPQIKMLDQTPVEANLKEMASAVVDATLPLPVQPGFFDGDATRDTATGFLARFLATFDQSRATLYDVYDENAVMSLTVNMTPPPMETRGSNSRNVNWNDYIKSSRNLIRVEKQNRRNELFVRGHASIVEFFTRLPSTVHDQSNPNKYVVDAIQHSGLYPGQPSAIVMSIMVHGEFTEGDGKTIRSFDRHFLVAPALPESRHAKAGWPCVILSDTWTLRLHSDGSAWQPKVAPAAIAPIPPSNEEQQRGMVIELRQRTGLNEHFATLCLAEMGWSFERALGAFEQAKATNSLPPEAFV